MVFSFLFYFAAASYHCPLLEASLTHSLLGEKAVSHSSNNEAVREDTQAGTATVFHFASRGIEKSFFCGPCSWASSYPKCVLVSVCLSANLLTVRIIRRANEITTILLLIDEGVNGCWKDQ